MAKIYERANDILTENYFAIIYVSPAGHKYITVNNVFKNVEECKAHWVKNETPEGFKYIEIVPIQNKQAYLYFKYWTSQNKWKFTEKSYDLFKYVFGCDFDIFSYFFKQRIEL